MTLSFIDTCRQIVDSKTAMKFGKVKIDLYSASAVIRVYDNLTKDNQLKFASMDPAVAIDLAFRMIS